MNRFPVKAQPVCTYASFPTRLGWVLAVSTHKGICLLRFMGQKQPSPMELEKTLLEANGAHETCDPKMTPHLEQTESALHEYLDHGKILPAVPLDFSRGTPFQISVWSTLCQIPHGETRTYGQVALALGKPGAARAVGQACGRNPVAVLVPCHRVVAFGGKAGGYSGGLHIKRALLQLERGQHF